MIQSCTEFAERRAAAAGEFFFRRDEVLNEFLVGKNIDRLEQAFEIVDGDEHGSGFAASRDYEPIGELMHFFYSFRKFCLESLYR